MDISATAFFFSAIVLAFFFFLVKGFNDLCGFLCLISADECFESNFVELLFRINVV